MQTTIPTTEYLWRKHFGETPQVNLKHPNAENFFQELSDVCAEEGKIKGINKQIIFPKFENKQNNE